MCCVLVSKDTHALLVAPTPLVGICSTETFIGPFRAQRFQKSQFIFERKYKKKLFYNAKGLNIVQLLVKTCLDRAPGRLAK